MTFILGLILLCGGIVIGVTEVWPKDRNGARVRRTRLTASGIAIGFGVLVLLA